MSSGSSGHYAGKRKSIAFSETALTKTKMPKLALDQLAALPYTARPGFKIQLSGFAYFNCGFPQCLHAISMDVYLQLNTASAFSEFTTNYSLIFTKIEMLWSF